jgi:hypothetical protein
VPDVPLPGENPHGREYKKEFFRIQPAHLAQGIEMRSGFASVLSPNQISLQEWSISA